MSTKLQKYKKITKQIRIDKELHKKLKLQATTEETVMSDLLNSIVEQYFDDKQNKSKLL